MITIHQKHQQSHRKNFRKGSAHAASGGAAVDQAAEDEVARVGMLCHFRHGD